MNKLIFFFAMISGCAVGVNAQTSKYRPDQYGFGIVYKPVTLKIDSLTEDRLGVVTVFFSCDDFPVELSVNGQDTITVTSESYNGFQVFNAEPEIVEGGPFRRVYTAYAKSPRAYTHRERMFFQPPQLPIN